MAACTAALQVFSASLALEYLGFDDSGPAILTALFGVGGLLGGIASFGLAGRRDLVRPMVLSTMAMAGAVILMGTLVNQVAVFAGMIIGGVGLVLFMVTGTTLMQRGIPSQSQAPVFGFNFLIVQGWASGIGGVRPVMAALDLRLAMVVTGVSMILIVFLAALAACAVSRSVPMPIRTSSGFCVNRRSSEFFLSLPSTCCSSPRARRADTRRDRRPSR